jgi:hypothetical protein
MPLTAEQAERGRILVDHNVMVECVRIVAALSVAAGLGGKLVGSFRRPPIHCGRDANDDNIGDIVREFRERGARAHLFNE